VRSAPIPEEASVISAVVAVIGVAGGEAMPAAFHAPARSAMR
jgi:hypothetical protein